MIAPRTLLAFAVLASSIAAGACARHAKIDALPPSPPASADESIATAPPEPAPAAPEAPPTDLMQVAEKTETRSEPSNENASVDKTVSAEVKKRAAHGACLKDARKRNASFYPTRYQIVVVVRADGQVKKVERDKRDTDVADPKFLDCLEKNLRGATFTSPGREITARLVFP